MKRNQTRAIVAVGIVVIAAYCGWRWLRPGLPEEVLNRLDEAEVFELLTIDPLSLHGDVSPEGDKWHGYRVLGRGIISDKGARDRLLESLNQSVREGGIRYACFNPRHALHATRDGHAVDMLICFECQQFELFDGDKHWIGTLSKSAEGTFKAAVNRMGLPVPKEPER